MTLSSLKELDKLMVLCRKRGVKSITLDGITFVMSDEEPVTYKSKLDPQIVPGLEESVYTQNEHLKIETPDALTQEQLLMWSVGSDA